MRNLTLFHFKENYYTEITSNMRHVFPSSLPKLTHLIDSALFDIALSRDEPVPSVKSIRHCLDSYLVDQENDGSNWKKLLSVYPNVDKLILEMPGTGCGSGYVQPPEQYLMIDMIESMVKTWKIKKLELDNIWSDPKTSEPLTIHSETLDEIFLTRSSIDNIVIDAPNLSKIVMAGISSKVVFSSAPLRISDVLVDDLILANLIEKLGDNRSYDNLNRLIIFTNRLQTRLEESYFVNLKELIFTDSMPPSSARVQENTQHQVAELLFSKGFSDRFKLTILGVFLDVSSSEQTKIIQKFCPVTKRIFSRLSYEQYEMWPVYKSSFMEYFDTNNNNNEDDDNHDTNNTNNTNNDKIDKVNLQCKNNKELFSSLLQDVIYQKLIASYKEDLVKWDCSVHFKIPPTQPESACFMLPETGWEYFYPKINKKRLWLW
eukprot:TRINITY_DN1823_c1_g1_i3.p1 TRINITY_DN1823_c1_g1~~TRINITY_DN1823_c1_g1_i3.p1  ORF type:complete len:431 (-),score=78.71 TRINITY_DN1823_c1_g1_i3:65-1357(-)